MIRIGFDIGGTFTDFAVWRGTESFNQILCHKVASTPPHFAEGVKAGLEQVLPQLQRKPGEPLLLVHGMTVGTNTVIERSGAAPAVLVTEGFRDILRLGRLRVPRPFDLFSQRTEALVPRRWVLEVPERLGADGSELLPLDTTRAVAAAREAHAAGIGTVVVCFLHSYANPAHELAARAAINAALPDLDVVLSHEVWPQEGEYERATLAVLNAYVKPVMSRYLGEIEAFLAQRAPDARLFVAKSNGGMMASSEARRFPVHTLLSGPAAGVTATQFLGTLIARPSLLTMDMGGTSTDMSLVRDGRPITSTQSEIGEFPLTLPVTTIEAMGAGGGSIVWLDDAVLKVGPRSSGALPGPACYGRGGTKPTLSDAYLLCGYLGEALLGGRLKLDRARAAAVFSAIAAPLGIPVEEAAEHSITVATATMVGRALPFLARLGVDPQQLTLLLFGGAGSIQGPLLAAELGIGEVLIPATPSVFCAAGCLVADIVHDAVRSIRARTLDLEREFAPLERDVLAWLDAQIDAGWLLERRVERYASMRYVGQSFQIDVAVPAGIDLAGLARIFHDEHRRLYAHAEEASPVEFVELRARVIGSLPRPSGGHAAPAPAAASGNAAARERRTIRLGGKVYAEAPIYARPDLPVGARVAGPAIVEQSDTTILVPAGFIAEAGAVGELRLVKAP